MARALQLSTRVVVERRARGFTLIEMMIVVVIIGVLATLATFGYRKLVTSSHISEATNMVQNIRVAQEGYHAETQQYANLTASVTGPYYPNIAPNAKVVTAWGAACGGQCVAGMDWSMLPLHVDGPVLFGYATTAGPANTSPSDASVLVNGQTLTFPSPSTTDWYIVASKCDLDGAGAPDTHVYATSWNNQTYVDQAGE